MEVRLTPSIEQVIPPQISFNFEEIKEELAGKLQVYQQMVVTEGGIKEAKADRANLNKFKTALSDSRKSVKRQWNQPLSEFEDKMNRMEVILGPYSLKQMKKSGRISAAAAVMGELMGIRPIITLIDGKTKVEGKVRGDDKVVPAMVELCKKRAGDVEDFDYMIGHTNIPQAAELEKACKKAFGKDPLTTFTLGGVVSANTGPDTLALVYVGHARD